MLLHLKAHLRFHLREHLVDGPHLSAIESAPEGTLKMHLRIQSAIYTNTHKKVHLRLH